jgi:hypothetical protein
MNKMNIKTPFIYQLRSYRNTVLTVYPCVYLLVLAICVFVNTQNSLNGGFEMVSIIAIFIIGLNSFKDDFKFFSANGVSRKTQICSTVASLGILSAILALIDTINAIIFTRVMSYRPMLIEAYGPRYGYSSNLSLLEASPILTPQILAEDFLWLLCSYLFFAIIGLLITTLFYRMTKAMKIAVGVAVPLLLLNGIPFLDAQYFGGVLVKALVNAVSVAWGVSNGYNPFIAMGSMLILSLMFAVLTFLLARRAVIKK